MKCMNYCPLRAIETAHSMVFLILAGLVVVVNPFLSTKVAILLTNCFHCYSGAAFETLYFLVQWSVALILFYVGYSIVHYLMQFPRINRVITYTSLTTWKFWRRYRIPPRERTVSAHPEGV